VDTVYDDNPYDDRGYGDDRRYPDDRGHDRRPPPTDRAPPRGAGGPKKVSYKSLAGMIVAIVALIMIFIFMAYPWYTIEYEAIYEPTTTKMNVKMEYTMEELTTEFKVGEVEIKDRTKYDDKDLNGTLDEVKEVMDNTSMIQLLVMIFLIIAIILMPIAAIGKIPHVAGMVFLILAIIFVLIIPLYFFVSLPPAIESQFDKMGDLGEPMNETFIYKPDFLSSGRGTWFNDANEKYSYTQEWGPGMGFWFIFVPLIVIVIAQVVFASGKVDVSPGRGLDTRPPPPPPRGRGRDRPPRDYGPPRPMRDEDYDYVGPDRGRPPGPRGRDDYGYSEPPPPRRRGGGGYDDYPPPRQRGGNDYDARPPPPPRPPRRREPY
jgi:hypothetical protein